MDHFPSGAPTTGLLNVKLTQIRQEESNKRNRNRS
jgi:hypothetical protein